MKIAQLLETSRGEQVMQFTEYLHNPQLKISKKLLPKFEKLGSMLFKDGWAWNNGAFAKSAWVIRYPLLAWKKSAMHCVRVVYTAKNDPNKPIQHASESYDIDDMIIGLQDNLEEVRGMAET